VGQKTALYQAGARFYSGVFGAFLSPDPLGPVVGDPRTLNPYAYAANNPMRYTDEHGLCFGEAMVACPENLSAEGVHMMGQMMCCEAGRISAIVKALSVVGQSSGPDLEWNAYWASLVLIAAGMPADSYEWSWEQRDVLLSTPWRSQFTYKLPAIGSAAEEAMIMGLLGLATGGSAGLPTSNKVTVGAKLFPNLSEKWKKHAAEFPEFKGAAQYEQNAVRLAKSSASDDILMKTRSRDGTTIIYERSTNTIVFVKADGTIATQFRPDKGITYFTKQ
jgi:RHS repeat-associated protein